MEAQEEPNTLKHTQPIPNSIPRILLKIIILNRTLTNSLNLQYKTLMVFHTPLQTQTLL